MIGKLKGRLTYANAVSTLCLFLLLGGGAYAATQLPRNSVGTRQLKRNAVSAPKLRRNAVTSAKVRNGAITQAKLAPGTLSAANLLGTPEAWHVVGAPGEPQFLNGWKNDAVASNPGVAFYRDPLGVVHLRGHAAGPSGTIMFDLPPGFRPETGKILDLLVFCKCSGGATTGALNVVGATGELPAEYQGALIPPGETVSLDGLSFRAES